MLGQVRFDPETGAPLSQTKEYPPYERGGGAGVRSPEPHPDAEGWHVGREGALTNGELESSSLGLLGHFRRTHRAARDEPNTALDRAAALAIKRIKADHDGIYDSLAWLVLAERLCRKGYWVVWMLDHFTPRCPHCGSSLKFKLGAGPIGYCASSASHGDVDEQIRELVCERYNETFATSDHYIDQLEIV
ncbi:hypothetical protein JMJ58_14790 [Haloterrigena salifodinae]|uniref:Uncharacterized protein n=1 Tax=Haloterrigena salifodinae TaxID=2675099 RepID=A0A8T8DYE8_9EURY|nr:hypothetical protein [Haloterrigena salifodinae]QRV14200.1 hypothetical protein JMJ58_14790 [Haloterrigena salifodinae]